MVLAAPPHSCSGIPSLLLSSRGFVLCSRAAVLAVSDPLALVLLAAVAAGLIGAYRAYSSLSQRFRGLELLYDFTRVTSSALQPKATLERIVSESARLLRAESARMILVPEEGAGPWSCMSVTGGQLTSLSTRSAPLPAQAGSRR